MTARLRSMVIDGERSILVYDRVGSLTLEQADRMTSYLQSAGERIGLAGALVFAEEVAVDGDPDLDLALLSDEVEAIRWAVKKLAGTDALADNPPRGHVHVLRTLLARIEGK